MTGGPYAQYGPKLRVIFPGVASTVLGASEGLGTNRMEEIELAGVPVDQVKRRFRRQNTAPAGDGTRTSRSSWDPHAKPDVRRSCGFNWTS